MCKAKSKVKDSVESFIKCMILSKSKLHPAKMIQTGTSGEERNDLADDTNDAVDDIVARLITADPIFRLFLLYTVIIIIVDDKLQSNFHK